MKELKELRFSENEIMLQDNLVRSAIIPESAKELSRNIIFKGNNVVEGAIFGQRIEVRDGDLEIQGATFAHNEIFIDSSATGNIIFRKAVGATHTIVSRAPKARMMFCNDINAKSVTLYNAFVAGSIYADEITLENCVVIGGVFATQQVDISNTMVGTFNSPSVRMAGINYLLLPSAFSIEKATTTPDTRLYSLSLADLGSIYKGMPQAPDSGKIAIDTNADEFKSVLNDGEVSKDLRSYTVVGKVLAADLIDTDKFRNHFLLTAAALGSQLLKTYDLGLDSKGAKAVITIEKVRDFLFDVLNGRTDVQEMNGTFDISEITRQ